MVGACLGCLRVRGRCAGGWRWRVENNVLMHSDMITMFAVVCLTTCVPTLR